jgi:hypothetical protein
LLTKVAPALVLACAGPPGNGPGDADGGATDARCFDGSPGQAPSSLAGCVDGGPCGAGEWCFESKACQAGTPVTCHEFGDLRCHRECSVSFPCAESEHCCSVAIFVTGHDYAEQVRWLCLTGGVCTEGQRIGGCESN